MYIYIVSINSVDELLFKKGKQNLLCNKNSLSWVSKKLALILCDQLRMRIRGHQKCPAGMYVENAAKFVHQRGFNGHAKK